MIVLISAGKRIERILLFVMGVWDNLAVRIWVWEYPEIFVSVDITLSIVYIQLVPVQCNNSQYRIWETEDLTENMVWQLTGSY